MPNQANSQFPPSPSPRDAGPPAPFDPAEAEFREPEVAGATAPRRVAWTLRLTTLLGVLILVSGQVPPVARIRPLGHLVSALGEALTVAALLAYLVDRRLNRNLADDISHKTSSMFFRDFLGGRYLPEPYYREMRELAATDTLSSGIVWALHLEWAEEFQSGRYLRVTSTVHNTFTNTSSRSIRHDMTWLMYIRDGRPPSFLTRFELTVAADSRRPDGIGDAHQFIATETNLAEANDIIRRGGSPGEYRGDTPEIPPATQVVFCASGVTYHARSGLMPLVCRYPTLSRRLTVEGPAVEDLEVDVRSDAVRLEPVTDADRPAALTYHTDRLAISGSTIRVQWTPKVLDGSVAVPNQASAVD